MCLSIPTNNSQGFEVSTAVNMMIIIFWKMTPCGSYNNSQLFITLCHIYTAYNHTRQYSILS
jgi:hypothetical protein